MREFREAVMLVRIKCRDEPLKKYNRFKLKDLWPFL